MKTITPPATEPITEIEFATHERIGDAPTTIAAKVYIRAARQAIETYLRRRLITQTVEFSLAGFGPHIHLPVDPVQSVTSISYTDDPGATQTLPAANYQTGANLPSEPDRTGLQCDLAGFRGRIGSQ